jgi:hypothetical protein
MESTMTDTSPESVTTIETEVKMLDTKPWLFISDQIFGEFRADHDGGYHGVSGTWWAFVPRPEYEQDRLRYLQNEQE